MRNSALIVLLLAAICGSPSKASRSIKRIKTETLALQGQQTLPPRLTQEETALIAEAYHLWKTLGENLWPGWTDIQAPLLYITKDYEYAIGFPPTAPAKDMVDTSGEFQGSPALSMKPVKECTIRSRNNVNRIRAKPKDPGQQRICPKN